MRPVVHLGKQIWISPVVLLSRTIAISSSLLAIGQKAAQNLNQLKNLDLSNEKITDLRPLSTLTNLEELSINSNQIEDLTPLSQLNLKRLSAQDNLIQDLSPLSQLSQLSALDLDNNLSVDNPVCSYKPA